MDHSYRLLSLLFCIVFFFEGLEIGAQDILINRDESKVPAYTLPDPLQKADGNPVRSGKLCNGSLIGIYSWVINFNLRPNRSSLY